MSLFHGRNAEFYHLVHAAISGEAAIFVAVLIGILLYFKADGGLNEYKLSWFFTFFVMLQFWNMFNAKAFMTGASAFKGLLKSPSFLAVALVILVGQYLIVTYGGTMFGVTPLPLITWGNIIVSTSLVLVVPEVWRAVVSLARLVVKR